MIYDLVNPSDPYTFEASSKEVAALVVIRLSTNYGAKAVNEEDNIPVFICFNAEEIQKWYKDTFGRTIEEGARTLRSEIIKGFESFVLGDRKERECYEAAIAAIDDPQKRSTFITKWDDIKRSSLNNIGGRACEIAQEMKKI